MDKDEESVGELRVMYTGFTPWVEQYPHVQYLLGKFWLADMSRKYLFFRDFDKIPMHKKVSIRMEILLVDITDFE